MTIEADPFAGHGEPKRIPPPPEPGVERGGYDGNHAYVVILTRTRKGRHPGAAAFDVVSAGSAAAAIRKAFPEGSPLLSVKTTTGAIAFGLGEPRDQVRCSLQVDKPKWGKAERWSP